MAIATSHYIREYFSNYTLFTHEDRYLFLPHLQKRSFSNSIRFVFFAGVGGVGHHVIEQVFHKCGMSCGEAIDITGLLWNSNFNSLFVFQNETVLLDVSRQIIHHYSEHNNITTSLAKPSKYYFLNCNNGYSMLSYPRFFTSQSMYEPNVHILGTLAESALIDYRVVIMTRDPFHSILSVLLRFVPLGANLDVIQRYIDQFALTQKHLLRQIEKMDNNFLSCLQYEKLAVDLRSVYNRVFNLNGSFNFTGTMNSIYHDSGKSRIVHGDEELVGFKGKFNVTYGDIKTHVNLKMRKDYEHLLHLCDDLK